MKERLIYIATIVILIIALSLSVNKCTSINHEYNRNIATLHDSIHYYKSKQGQLVATTKLYETNIKNLKYLNDSLYNTIKSLKAKNITQATQFSGQIINETHDTVYIIKNAATGIVEIAPVDFNFSNQYRLLEGRISANRDSLYLNIDKDIVNFDYTVALDKKNNIHITSTNPYVKYNSISGFTLPKQKQKRWSIGPTVGVGVDVTNGKISPQVGIGISYGIIKF